MSWYIFSNAFIRLIPFLPWVCFSIFFFSFIFFFFTSSFGSFSPYPSLPPSLPFSHLTPLPPSLPFSHLPPCLSHSVHHPPILVSTTFLHTGFLPSFLLFTFLPLCLVRNKSQIKQIPLLLLLHVGRSTRLASRSWLLVGPLSHPKNKVEIMN